MEARNTHEKDNKGGQLVVRKARTHNEGEDTQGICHCSQ